MTKWVYSFETGNAEGGATMKALLGGKGANLAEMCSHGIPVPAGFTITTGVCTHFYQNDRTYPDDLEGQVETALERVEAAMGSGFGAEKGPLLLVSVRSGARASMPGMMDTVLDLGLNDQTVEHLCQLSGDRRFAYDSYRRFIQMYGGVVLGIDGEEFEGLLEAAKRAKGKALDTELEAEDWIALIARYKRLVEDRTGLPFPQDPRDQLWGAIGAVFRSWMNRRAVTYRKLHGIPADWGTAVNVQAMVFGNMGEDCATGVCFTRNPSTGENAFYGEFLENAQGEDVVAGIRTPQPLSLAEKTEMGAAAPAMEELLPDLYRELDAIRHRLERLFHDMQDMEFTIERGKLWILQTRTGKRTAQAALRMAVEMHGEGLIDRAEAVARVEPAQLEQLMHPMVDPNVPKTVLATGLPASPGAGAGQVVFTAEDAEAWAEAGKAVVLVRIETSPEDIAGMHVAKGIVTTRGGMTSHAAVVARGMGRPCVASAGGLAVDPERRHFKANGETIAEGDWITVDGSTGEVLKGQVATVAPEISGNFGRLLEWADALRVLEVRANAETPQDARAALEFGAEGIGLCRTEHMFFDPERITHMREMILAAGGDGRRGALAKLLPYQRGDFADLFRIMSGRPVTIRLLDPPLHEFLPHDEDDMAEVALSAGTTVDAIRARAEELGEVNPMLGLRGCRLGIVHPEIYEMQARAIFEAAAEVIREGVTLKPEVMIPLIATRAEFDDLKQRIDEVAEAVIGETGQSIDYMIGTMIELPRAALVADDIAQTAEFFSFGTNDLTQTTFGLSRDDSAAFLGEYRARGILTESPFVSIDRDGVGRLVRFACEAGRRSRPDIKLGICGEHGGDPASIRFCHQIGLDYVSCSPFRVPIARLAAAHAALEKAAISSTA